MGRNQLTPTTCHRGVASSLEKPVTSRRTTSTQPLVSAPRVGWRGSLVAAAIGLILATVATASVGAAPTAAAASPAVLSTVTVTPSDVVGGDAVTGAVTLSAPAPAGGVVVALSSDDPTAATVAASVTVLAGETFATFPIATVVVPNPRSSLIIGTTGGVTAYAILTVWTPFAFTHGNLSVFPGGVGTGTVTSKPTGLDCRLADGGGTGTCSAFFPVGTIVRLTAKAAPGSTLAGIRGVGCATPSKITISRGSNISCQVGFTLK
jgi:trimeric autotransporter adhesin